MSSINYSDNANIYQFAYENARYRPFERVSTTVKLIDATAVEDGPVRVRLRTTLAISVPECASIAYVREYLLAVEEPMLRCLAWRCGARQARPAGRAWRGPCGVRTGQDRPGHVATRRRIPAGTTKPIDQVMALLGPTGNWEFLTAHSDGSLPTV